MGSLRCAICSQVQGQVKATYKAPSQLVESLPAGGRQDKHADGSSPCTPAMFVQVLCVVADDFGYNMPGQRQKKVSERCWWFPSTTWRQVTCNVLNNSGDGALTMVPLYRGLSGTEFTLGGQWKSRGQVGQSVDVTGGFIYYLYLPDDSSWSHLIWLRGWRGLYY